MDVASIEILSLEETRSLVGMTPPRVSELPPPLTTRGERAAVAFWPVALAFPIAAGLILRAFRGPKSSLLGGLGFAVGLGLVRWQLARWFTESPGYQVEQRIGPIEIRHYGACLLLETTVTHRTFEESLDIGFTRLHDYLEKEGIAMTTPVTARIDDGGITVGFHLPQNVNLAPEPEDPRLTVREVPPCRIAALRYAGTYTDAVAHQKQKDLLAGLRSAGIEPRGEAWMAAFDPPSTLTPLRRVEAQVEIA